MEAARLVESADLPAVLAIGERIRDELAPNRGGSMLLAAEDGRTPWRDRLTSAVADTVDEAGADVVIVGTFDDVVFGICVLRHRRLADGSSVGELDDFAVDAEAREVGIGEAMMNLAIERVRAAGGTGIGARALPGDRETKNFFESFGLKARQLLVHRDLTLDD